MSSQQIHFFQCSFCKSTATCTVLVRGSHIDCPLCHRWMAHKYSYAVQTDEDRALAARGLVLNPHLALDPNRLRHCDNCRTRVPVVGMINLSAAGKFCTEACANTGAAKHEAYMKRLQDEEDARTLRQRPWLQKESA